MTVDVLWCRAHINLSKQLGIVKARECLTLNYLYDGIGNWNCDSHLNQQMALELAFQRIGSWFSACLQLLKNLNQLNDFVFCAIRNDDSWFWLRFPVERFQFFFELLFNYNCGETISNHITCCSQPISGKFMNSFD